MCRFPNYMCFVGQYTKDGKPDYRFIGHHEYDALIKEHGTIPYVQVPCMKCIECRIQYSRQWADRCVLEAKQYQHNYFVTLTYDDNFLPDRNSLKPKDLQDFLKRLRRKLDKKFPGLKMRFFASGEYGDTSWRPHYHLILFNCPLDDLTYQFQRRELVSEEVRFKKNGKIKFKREFGPWLNYNLEGNKKDMMFSKFIYEAWQYQGNISVQMFDYANASYVAQYVMKKIDGSGAELYKELKIVPEFIRMSNRPGIGANYFKDHPDCLDAKIVIPANGHAHLSQAPRYFDKLFIQKYGDDVFIPYQIKRFRKKLIREKTYLKDGSRNYDREADIRNYNLRKNKALRDAI